MKAAIRTRAGHVLTTSEHENVKDLFRSVAQLQEVFSSDSECGACKSADLSFRVRTVDANEFFELVCNSCSASLSFGQTRQGNNLFPKRKDADGLFLPNGGWKVWKALPAGHQ